MNFFCCGVVFCMKEGKWRELGEREGERERERKGREGQRERGEERAVSAGCSVASGGENAENTVQIMCPRVTLKSCWMVFVAVK